MKLGIKLILGFLVVALLVGVVGFVGYQSSTKILASEIESKFAGDAGDVMNTIDIVMHDRYKDIQGLALNSIITNEESLPEEITAELIKFKKLYGFKSASFFDMNRIRIADTESLHLGKQHKMVVYWERALEGKITSGQDIRIAEELQIPIIYFAAPVKNKEGKQFGVVVARYNPEEINEIAAAAALEAHVTLFDQDRNIIFSSDPYYKDKILKEKIIELPSVKAVLKGGDGTIREYHEHNGFDAITYYAHEKGHKDFAGNDWSLILSINKDKAFAPVTVLGKTTLIITLVGLIFAVLLGFLLSRSISKPIIKLKDSADKISKGNLGEPIEIKTHDEIGELAESFDNMRYSLKMVIDEYEKMKGKGEVEKKVTKKTTSRFKLSSSESKKKETHTKQSSNSETKVSLFPEAKKSSHSVRDVPSGTKEETPGYDESVPYSEVEKEEENKRKK